MSHRVRESQIISIVLLSCLLCFGIYAATHGKQAPLPEWPSTEECGIGFDLTPSYGTSAISCANGTSKQLVILNGSEPYKSLMQRLPQWYTQPGAPTEREKIRVLGFMLDFLRQDTEKELGYRIRFASTTVPYLGGLGYCVGDKIVKAAFEKAAMHYVRLIDRQWTGEPVTLPQNSVLAAHGLGLCQPYTETGCHRYRRLPGFNYLVIGYYEDGLEAALLRNASSAYASYSDPQHDYQLGSNMMHKYPDENHYWEKVKDFLNKVSRYRLDGPLARVICYGNSCDNDRFRRVVNGEIDRFWGHENRPVWIEGDGVDPRFAAALGTAEFVLRHPYFQVVGLESELELRPASACGW